MEEKWIPKKLEKAKDNYGIPSGGNWGVPGEPGHPKGESSGAGKAVPEVPEPRPSPRGSQPWDSSEALLPRAGLELQALCGKEEKKPCAVASHLVGCKTQDKLRHFHFLYINLWFSQGTALH